MKQRLNKIRDLEKLKEIVENLERTEVSEFEAWNEVRDDGLIIQRCEFKCEMIENWWDGWYMVELIDGKWISRGRIEK